MISWGEAVDEIRSPRPPEHVDPRRAARLFPKAPVVICGAAGSGKTRLWESLTGRQPSPAKASYRSDDGFLARKSRATIALRTVPGQECREHYETLREVFDPESTLRGVIFVASYGFDHVWPSSSGDVIANSLHPYTIQRLRERNLREELASFDRTCREIGQKYARSSRTIQWLQILVNKADLYWSEIDEVANYYSTGGHSPFSRTAAELLGRIGSQSLEWSVLPCAQQPSGYRFDSTRGKLEVASVLSDQQCGASVALVKTQLEALSERTR